MKKKKGSNNYFFLIFLITVFVLIFFALLQNRPGMVLNHNSDNGNGNNNSNNSNGNAYGHENNNDNSNDDKDDDDDSDSGNSNNQYQIPLPVYPQPTTSVTSYPTVIVTPPIYIQPTVSVVVYPTQPATPTEPIGGDSNNYQPSSSNNASSEEVVVVVPVSERSVVSSVDSNSRASIVVPTKSIFKKIENKIKGVGGSGQFLSRPKKSNATPTPTKKEDDFSPPVALGPDSSIFYMLTDTDLLLGAVDKEDKRINVDEVELRGAEITMDKVLKKKGLDLGVSSGGSLVLTENGTRAYFEMPVFVDVFSHEISVDTASGKKQIKTTPAKAVVDAIESGYIENLAKKAQITMEVIKGDELVYKIEGDEEFKVFGRFNAKGKQSVYVDVETGEVREGDQPLLSQFLKLISL